MRDLPFLKHDEQQTSKNGFLCAGYRGDDPAFSVLLLGPGDSLARWLFCVETALKWRYLSTSVVQQLALIRYTDADVHA